MEGKSVLFVAQTVSPNKVIGTAGQSGEIVYNTILIVSKQSGYKSIDNPFLIAGKASVPLPFASHKLTCHSAPSGNVAELERVTRHRALIKLRLPRHRDIPCAVTHLSMKLSALEKNQMITTGLRL